MESEAGYLAERIGAVREHVIALVTAIPGLPAEIARVRGELALEWENRPPGLVLGLIAVFVIIGFALETAYRYKVPRPAVDDQSVRERLRSVGLRLAIDLGAVAVFALGSMAVFVAFTWPP